MSEWISVEKEMPPYPEYDNEQSMPVLTYSPSSGIMVAYFNKTEGDWFDMDGEWVEPATHWMDLPEDPDEA